MGKRKTRLEAANKRWPRKWWKFARKSFRNGNSFDPGLPKTVVTHAGATGDMSTLLMISLLFCSCVSALSPEPAFRRRRDPRSRRCWRELARVRETRGGRHRECARQPLQRPPVGRVEVQHSIPDRLKPIGAPPTSSLDVLTVAAQSGIIGAPEFSPTHRWPAAQNGRAPCHSE